MEDARMPPMPTTDLRLTVEDYELFPDDGRRHELIDGEHVVTPAPTGRHQLVAGNLHLALRGAADADRLGLVLFAPFDVVLSRHDVVQPDLVFLGRERWGSVPARAEAPPHLAVEIVSPSSRHTDEVRKRRVYERFGVVELWIVDPELEVVRIYRREGQGGFARPVELSAEREDLLQTPLLPALRLPVATVFAEPGA
jgi:Uma2 family endonuclease